MCTGHPVMSSFSSHLFLLIIYLVGDYHNYALASQPQSPMPKNEGFPGSSFQQLSAWPNLQLAVFVDLNADRRLDIVFVDTSGTELYALIEPGAKSTQQFGFQQSGLQTLPAPIKLLAPGFPDPIRSVASADFNGDSVADLLLVTSNSVDGPFQVYIAYGKRGSDNSFFESPLLLATLISQPLVCDLNSDMIADVYGESSDSRMVYFGGKSITNVSTLYAGPKWSSLGYSAFGDLNGDRTPDIIILVSDAGTMKLQVLERHLSSIGTAPDVSQAQLIDLDPKLLGSSQPILGLFALDDFDGDGYVDLLLPACTTSDCVASSSIFLYSFKDNKRSTVEINWIPTGIPTTENIHCYLTPTPDLAGSKALSVSALVGSTVADINLDGKRDIGLGMTCWKNNNQKLGTFPAILLNNGKSSDGSLSMSVYLLSDAELPSGNDLIRQIAFFDQAEDGILDLLVVSTSSSGTPSTQLFLHSLSGDPYFLKVTVLNGLCSSADFCTDGRLPYGLTVPGISTTFDTEAPEGGRQLGSSLLGMQSCCSSLQVPFSIFGLGSFANYVEELVVTIPPSNESVRSRVINFLVPKAQVVINPYPPNNPSAWTTKLFLQPLYDMKVVYIAITLLCVCVVLIIIIGILQWFEFREDRSEKQKEAQRFHFDAM